MITFARAAVALALLAVSFHARAIDGVGLFELFPILGWIVWLLLFTGAALVLRIGFRADPRTPSRLRKAMATVVAAFLLSPVAIVALSAGYVRYLCGTQSAFHSYTRLESWSPSRQRLLVRGVETPVERNGISETNPAPGLLEYQELSELILGIREYKIRLVDQQTGKTLLSAHFFGSSRAGTMACEAAPSYWRVRQGFVRKAWDGNKA